MEAVERALRSLKDCLKRDQVKKISQEVQDKLTFSINAHPQEGAVGTAAEHFLGMSPRNHLPNSVNRFIDYHKLIKNRRNKQVQITQKKGNNGKTHDLTCLGQNLGGADGASCGAE